MILSHQTTKRSRYFWNVILSFALLCAQGVKLHVHSLDHASKQNHTHNHMVFEDTASHSHLSIAHYSTDLSHSDYHDEVVSEMDASPHGLLEKVSNSVRTLALLAVFLTLFCLYFYRNLLYKRLLNGTVIHWRYLFSPPLRAPPR